MSRIDRAACAIAAVLQPLTGGRASGTAVMLAESSDVDVPRNTYVVPVLHGVERFDLMLKTAVGANADGSTTVTSAGATVPLISNVGGGKYHQIPEGAELRVLDGPAGVLDLAFMSTAMTGATDPHPQKDLQTVAVYERQGFPIELDFYRAHVAEQPALIIVWEGSELGDSATTQALEYAATVGQTAKLYTERFGLLLVCNRHESYAIRRYQSLTLADRVLDTVTGRRSVDGQVFSNPASLVVHERIPQALNNAQDWQAVYGVLFRCSITQVVRKCETRTFSPWLVTKIDSNVPMTNLPTDPNPLEVVVDDRFEMPGWP